MENKYLDEINLDCALVVNSCDAYADVWELFFTALSDHWHNCKIDIYLNTETKTYKFEKLNIKRANIDLSRGKRIAWGERLIQTLDSVDKEYVIMLFDDFVLEKKVNLEKLYVCLTYLKKNPDISVFYFNNIAGKNVKDGMIPEFERLGSRNDFRLNSAPAIWRKNKLRSFTGEIDSPWAWEVFGSIRTFNVSQRFYCADKKYEDVFVYNYTLGGAIRRGKWVVSVVRPILEKYKINLDLSRRGLASESLSEGKYSLKWKIDFFILGFRMVGPKAVLIFYRSVMKKYFNL